MDDPGFEGIGDFGSADPWERHVAHQAAKGDWPSRREAQERRDLEAEGSLGRVSGLEHLGWYTEPRKPKGRPRVDKLDHMERAAELLAAEPYLSAGDVAFRLRIRRQDAGRIVAAFRRVQGASQTRGGGV